jgi:hypothetical protein
MVFDGIISVFINFLEQVHLKLLHGNTKTWLKSKPLLMFILRDCDGSTTVGHLQVFVLILQSQIRISPIFFGCVVQRATS